MTALLACRAAVPPLEQTSPSPTTFSFLFFLAMEGSRPRMRCSTGVQGRWGARGPVGHDTALVSPHHGDSAAVKRVAESARRRKQRLYPEFSGHGGRAPSSCL